MFAVIVSSFMEDFYILCANITGIFFFSGPKVIVGVYIVSIYVVESTDL